VNPGREFHIHPQLDGLEKIHHQVMRDVKAAQGEHIFVLRPLAADQLDVEAFFFEKALFDGGKNRSFAGEADVADADFGEAGFGIGLREAVRCDRSWKSMQCAPQRHRGQRGRI
jgi:hypothetical protein